MKFTILAVVLVLAGCEQRIAVFDQDNMQKISDACVRSSGAVKSETVNTGVGSRTYNISCRAQHYESK